MTKSISVATKLTKKEAELIEKISKEYGFMNKSEAVRSAIRLYINLLSLPSRDRLRVLQIINELIAPSGVTSSELVEQMHTEEDT
ncbi:MAG: ribbon-helix-helix protein, CopG family [Nitrososphaerota archaeon]|nr:ribbon-helix-helix protein, CopG family [Nitrososphaerota archaeon]